jgi:hypothetical protein
LTKLAITPNSELRILLREQQEFTEPARLLPVTADPNATVPDQHCSLIRGPELQLKSPQDENPLLANEGRLTDTHLNDQIRHLSSQFAEHIESAAPSPGIDIEHVA